jgi:type IV secretory pathway VirB2 component (pilin)
MFCSGCGNAILPGQGFCPQCGRPVAGVAAPVPVPPSELEGYAGKVKVLSLLWFVYAGLSLLMGIARMTFARAIFMGHFGHWTGSPMPPMWFGPTLVSLGWFFLVVRFGLALVTGWGLRECTEWGRIVAIVAGILSLFRFPLGTALGIWTLILLLGDRNSCFYEQLKGRQNG